MNKTRAIFLSIALTAFLTSAFWVGAGALIYTIFTRTPPDLQVEVTAPEKVQIGESLKMKIEVTNPTGERVALNSIDIYDELLDGFEITAIDPKPHSRRSTGGFASFYFSPGKSDRFIVTMDLRAKKAGSWGGDIDCCTVWENFVTYYTEITVEPEATDSTATDSTKETTALP